MPRSALTTQSLPVPVLQQQQQQQHQVPLVQPVYPNFGRLINVGGGVSAGYNLGPGYAGGYDVVCNKLSGPCSQDSVFRRNLYVLVSAAVDLLILFFLQPFEFIGLLQYYFPGLVKLLLNSNLVTITLDIGYMVIGYVVKLGIWSIV